MAFPLTALLNPTVYDHPVTAHKITVIETHSSWVLLTGDFAYKIKKPVNFGFLDFSTLDKRYHCCQQEIRLNRRLAAELYLEVIAITGSATQPRLLPANTEPAEPFEYAVKMRQFPQSAQLDHQLHAGKLDTKHILAIADRIADFHAHIPSADHSVAYGDQTLVYQPIKENFALIQQHLPADHAKHYAAVLAQLQHWNQQTVKAISPHLQQRKQQSFIRECHGDLHLRNLIWLHDKPMAFDCIEFNPELRWIDVICDIAFLLMDLHSQQQQPLATLLLNRYLEQTGDYAAVALLPFYLCYRALVKAKISALRLEQEYSEYTREQTDKNTPNNTITYQQTRDEFDTYLALAKRYTKPSTPRLIIMCGLSASGKSTVSQQLLMALEAIRIRTDCERKRLFSVPVTDHNQRHIYSPQASKQTYAHLITLTTQVIQAGYSVIVDGAFLHYAQRKLFHTLADQLAVPFVLLHVTATKEVLRQRIVTRKEGVSDANLAVLEQQFLTWQPFREDEKAVLMSVNTEHEQDVMLLVNAIASFS